MTNIGIPRIGGEICDKKTTGWRESMGNFFFAVKCQLQRKKFENDENERDVRQQNFTLFSRI